MNMRSAVAPGLVLAIGLGACGSSSSSSSTRPAAQAAPAPRAPEAPRPSSPLSLPPGVPLKGTGPAHAPDARVIRGWLAALRHGDVAKAAGFFGEPSKVQNGTPVLTLRTRAERVAFNQTFPCGAEAVALRDAARGFTFVTYRLTERRGGNCGDGTGSKVNGAVRVRGGRISEWYRLPDDGNPAPQPPTVTDPAIGIA